MIVPSAIRLTTQQARSVAGVSPEEWRHWRKNLPYFATKNGKAVRFSMGEIVALCAVKDIVSLFGIRVAMLSEGIDQIFQKSAPRSLLFLQDCSYVVTANSGEIQQKNQTQGSSSAAIVVPCESFVDQILTATFQSSDQIQQKNLPFPPAEVRRGTL